MEQSASFGYWLRRRRKALDLTQDELARQVGCALGTVKKLETDERRPSREMAARLADCLAIPDDDRAAFLIFFAKERQEHAHPKIKTLEEIETDPENGDQNKPKCLKKFVRHFVSPC